MKSNSTSGFGRHFGRELSAERLTTGGFSIIESIIAMALGILVAVALTTITIYGLKNSKNMQSEERLYSSANFFTQRSAYLMKQAKNFTVTSPSTLEIVLPSKTVIIEKSGNDILIEGEKVNASGVTAENLKFTPMQRSVRINFVLKSGTQNFSGTTTVARRNAL